MIVVSPQLLSLAAANDEQLQLIHRWLSLIAMGAAAKDIAALL